jgi:branched-chain amino acid transport system permease protein
LQQVLVGLSRTTILFIVASGLSLVLGVLRIPNVAHGSLYMTGAFVTYSVATLFGQSALGFWLALIVAPLGGRASEFRWSSGVCSVTCTNAST